MNKKGTVLIVLYNKDIKKSETFQSLVKYSKSLKNIDLLIWNNGPNSIDKNVVEQHSFLFSNVDIIEDLNNCGLAKVYNYTIENKTNSFYVFLDDDSKLSEDYIDSLLDSNENYCYIPILTHNGKVQSPTINKEKVTNSKLPNKIKKFRAVGSGIIIGNNVVKNLMEKYGTIFDERFLLYGVDTTFFIRLERANELKSLVVIPGFEHSYSRLSKEEDPISSFRHKERAYDSGLRARYYKNPISLIIYTIRTAIKSLVKKESTERLILKAILTGKHYRDK